MRLCAAILLLGLGGCDAAGVFADYEIPEAPGTAEAPWPLLVNTPRPPPRGVYTEAVPDPLAGIVIRNELAIASRAQAAQAEGLAGPVVDGADLRDRAAAPTRMPQPAVDEAELTARARAAGARAERLSAPVLSEAERERLRAAAE